MIGSALTNLIFAPDDCHVIEFNEYPDGDVWTNAHGKIPVRSMILNGHWESTVSGEYWNLEVSKKHPTNFYDGNVRMSIRELLQVFKQMGLLKADVDINQYPVEEHTIWKKEEREGFPLY